MLNGDSGRLLSGAPGQKLGVVRPHCPPQSDSGLKRYFIWFENFAVNKIEPFESAFKSLLNVLQVF